MNIQKSIYTVLALGTLAGLASCSNDTDIQMPGSGDGVQIKIQLPVGMQTRGTFGDGSDAGDRAVIDNLQYTVFEKIDGDYQYVLDNKSVPAFTNNPSTGKEETTVNLALGKGKTYKVVFYADNDADKFATYDAKTGNFKVNYTELAANIANEDAFIGQSNDITVNGAVMETVTLTRPFAQLNWGTDDKNEPILASYIDNMTATVNIESGLFENYNIISGEYTGEYSGKIAAQVKVKDANVTQSFPVKHADQNKVYELIAMNYLLTGEKTLDLTLSFSNGHESVNVNAAPVKPNYRTNIYGSLLTSPAEFKVIVDRDFIDNINQPTSTEPTIDAVAKTVEIATAAQLISFAKMSNDKSNNYFKGYTITLTNDIDLAGVEWTPIGDLTQKNHFSGVFDGNGKTISNLTIENGTNGAGLVGDLQGTVKNLTLKNVKINAKHWAGAVAGYTTDNSGANIYNITVDGFEIALTPNVDANGNPDDGDKAGAIIGYMANDDALGRCTVKNGKISGYRDLGGIVGALDSKIGDCVVENVEIISKQFNFSEAGKNFGIYFGRNVKGAANVVNSTYSNVIINGVAQ